MSSSFSWLLISDSPTKVGTQNFNRNMFIIKSNVSEKYEFQTSVENAWKFFADGNNYVELMPNLDSIQTDGRGISRWDISVNVPMIGNWKMSFAVDFLTADDMIEWYPSNTEKQNFLRCVTQLVGKTDNLVQVRITHNLELRRPHAKDFHLLAGMAGESLISQEMQSEVTKMLKIFVQKAKERLEK